MVLSLADVMAKDLSEEEIRASIEVLKCKKVAVFIVAYNAERHLESVVERIPKGLRGSLAEIFVIDDSSTDTTYEIATRIKRKYCDCNFNVYRTPYNRGYGGNQKLGYLYCIRNLYDIVILLHGDGQYAPEYIPRILAAFSERVDAVFASRMINKKMALKGGMPFYKWIGNQVLTTLENKLLGTNLSEFHTGFRAYRVSSLEKIPFVFNSDDFHFDTEIIIQAIANKWKIKEVAIPTHYGDEKCHVNGIKYAFNCLKSVLSFHLVNLGLFYQRNYDFGLFDTENYQFKTSPHSLHQYVINRGEFNSHTISIELGANRGILSSHISRRVKHHVAVDIFTPDLAGGSEVMALDLNLQFSKQITQRGFDCCIALDVIEHLNEPENFLSEAFELLRAGGKLYISTANVCYLPIRLSLLLGQFNYGKRGILDKTHKRLFSVSSFKKLITQYGFKIETIKGFAPPLTDLVSNHIAVRVADKIHTILSRWLPNLFAYNFLVVATRMDAISDIFRMTIDENSGT